MKRVVGSRAATAIMVLVLLLVTIVNIGGTAISIAPIIMGDYFYSMLQPVPVVDVRKDSAVLQFYRDSKVTYNASIVVEIHCWGAGLTEADERTATVDTKRVTIERGSGIWQDKFKVPFDELNGWREYICYYTGAVPYQVGDMKFVYNWESERFSIVDYDFENREHEETEKE